MRYEAHQDGQQANDAVHALHGRLRRMSGILPVCLQDFLHGGQPALREVRRGNRHSPSRLREGLFLCILGLRQMLLADARAPRRTLVTQAVRHFFMV